MSSEWKQLQLKDLGRIVTGKTPSTEFADYFGGSIPFLTPTDMVDGQKTVTTSRTLTDKGLATVKNCLVPSGVAVSCIGWQMGKSVLLTEPVVTNQQINTIVVDESRFDRNFVYYLLLSMRKQIFELGATPTRTPIVNKSTFEKIAIRVPDLYAQKIIADWLTVLDDRITLLRETNATLEAIAQALFKSWFVDFEPVRTKQEGRAPEGMDEATAALFPDAFEESELGLVPRGWRVSTLDDVSDVGIGKTPPRKEAHWFSESPDDVRWVSIRDMGSSGTFLSETSEYLTEPAIEKFNVRRIPDNTALLSFKLTIGRVAITDGEMTTNEAIAHFKIYEQSPLPTEFIYLYLRQFNFSVLGSTSSIAEAVNSKTVKRIPVIVPDRRVISAFQDAIEDIFCRIKTVQQQAQTLATLRDTLLPRLISGQLRLPEAEAEALAA